MAAVCCDPEAKGLVEACYRAVVRRDSPAADSAEVQPDAVPVQAGADDGLLGDGHPAA